MAAPRPSTSIWDTTPLDAYPATTRTARMPWSCASNSTSPAEAEESAASVRRRSDGRCRSSAGRRAGCMQSGPHCHAAAVSRWPADSAQNPPVVIHKQQHYLFLRGYAELLLECMLVDVDGEGTRPVAVVGRGAAHRRVLPPSGEEVFLRRDEHGVGAE